MTEGKEYRSSSELGPEYRIQNTEYRSQNRNGKRKYADRYFEDLTLRRRLKLSELLNSVFCFLFSDSRPFRDCIFPN